MMQLVTWMQNYLQSFLKEGGIGKQLDFKNLKSTPCKLSLATFIYHI